MNGCELSISTENRWTEQEMANLNYIRAQQIQKITKTSIN
jgi:hypothetical protein